MSLPKFRRSQILKLIENQGSVTVADLVNDLNVSGMTIRRDLDELEKGGFIQRIHGGAVNAQGRSYEPPYLLRASQAIEAKQAIGSLAAELVADGDSIALGIGSTTLELAKNLISRRNLTIVTPSLHIANLFLNQPDVRLIIPGGIVRPGEASLIGDLARQSFQGLFVDRLFLGVGGMDVKFGLTEHNWDDAMVKQAMIKNAKEVIILADRTKFGKVAFAFIAQFSAIHKFVTDGPPPDELSMKLNESGVKVYLVGDASNHQAKE